VFEAYKRVKRNKGGEGCDGISLQDFEVHLKSNLYKIWNRLSSGSYMPPPVLRVEIVKSDGGIRPLGIPAVSDRIAQMVIKQRIEPGLDRIFHPDSYGYRSKKSALDAIGTTRQRCWKRAWVLDMDIKGFFDNIDHELLMLAVNKHVKHKWMRLYIERWLKASVQHRDGRLETRDVGTPQGGVISPLLANLYLHYVFDMWVEKNWNGIQFARYADDIVCHCITEGEAQRLLGVLKQRFNACGLILHPEKTKIVYCKSINNRLEYPRVSFDFLGHTFKPRLIRAKTGVFMVGFTPSISRRAAKTIRSKVQDWKLIKHSQNDLTSIAKARRSAIAGWINFFGKYGRAEIKRTLYYINEELVRWARRKYKRLNTKRKALRWLRGVRRREPNLFVHWEIA
jgi:group II intron reverse transcriptase/maturase